MSSAHSVCFLLHLYFWKEFSGGSSVLLLLFYLTSTPHHLPLTCPLPPHWKCPYWGKDWLTDLLSFWWGLLSLYLTQYSLTRGDFAPRGYLAMIGDILGYHNWHLAGVLLLSISMHRTAPTTEYPAQRVSSAQAEKHPSVLHSRAFHVLPSYNFPDYLDRVLSWLIYQWVLSSFLTDLCGGLFSSLLTLLPRILFLSFTFLLG